MHECSRLLADDWSQRVFTMQIGNLDKWQAQAQDLEKQSENPKLWEDPDRSRAVTQKLTSVKQQISQITGLTSQLEDGQTLLELLGTEVTSLQMHCTKT